MYVCYEIQFIARFQSMYFNDFLMKFSNSKDDGWLFNIHHTDVHKRDDLNKCGNIDKFDDLNYKHDYKSCNCVVYHTFHNAVEEPFQYDVLTYGNKNLYLGMCSKRPQIIMGKWKIFHIQCVFASEKWMKFVVSANIGRWLLNNTYCTFIACTSFPSS